MPARRARSAPRPPFGVPRVTAVVRAANPTCQNTGSSQKFTRFGVHPGNPDLVVKYRLVAGVRPRLGSLGRAPHRPPISRFKWSN